MTDVIDKPKNHAKNYVSDAIRHLASTSLLWKQLSHERGRNCTYHLYFATEKARNLADKALKACVYNNSDSPIHAQDNKREHEVDGTLYYTLYIPDIALAETIEAAFKENAPEFIIDSVRDSGGGRMSESPVSEADIAKLQAMIARPKPKTQARG